MENKPVVETIKDTVGGKVNEPIITPPTPSINPPAKTKLNRKDELVYLMEQCINKEAGGLISNIGVNSIYWDYLREFRTLNVNP